jgi:hypothetical protein
MRALIAFSLLASLAIPVSVRAEGPHSVLDRDIEGYVMATCLAQVDDASLKEQGNAWAGAIAQRSHGDFEKFLPLASAVKEELAKTGVGVAHRDGPVGNELSMPVQTCAEIEDRPAIQRAMATVRSNLRRSYGAAK